MVCLTTTSDFAAMPGKAWSGQKKRPTNYIRQWRKHRHLTQEQLAGRVEMTASSISQLESGKQGYTDQTLAAIAHALTCEPADLLARDPTKPEYQLWRIITGLNPDQQAQALRVLKALASEEAA